MEEDARKKLLIALGVGTFVVLIMVGVGLYVVSRRSAQNDFAAFQQQVNDNASDCAAGDTACLDRAVLTAVTDQKDPDLCEQISDPGIKDACFLEVAVAAKDLSGCEDVQGVENKQLCTDTIHLFLARENRSLEECQLIVNQDWKASCEASADPLTASNCASKGMSAETCAAFPRFETAVAQGDYAACTTLPEPFVNDCRDATEGSDPDQDGLSGSEETRYGTSNQNPDTDGDGFNDGAEVAGGFNPNGPGKL